MTSSRGSARSCMASCAQSFASSMTICSPRGRDLLLGRVTKVEPASRRVEASLPSLVVATEVVQTEIPREELRLQPIVQLKSRRNEVLSLLLLSSIALFLTLPKLDRNLLLVGLIPILSLHSAP